MRVVRRDSARLKPMRDSCDCTGTLTTQKARGYGDSEKREVAGEGWGERMNDFKARRNPRHFNGSG